MKIAISLTRARNKREGITRYASEVYCALKKVEECDVYGEAVIGLKDATTEVEKDLSESFPQARVDILKTIIPMRYITRWYESGVKIPPFVGRYFEKKDLKIFFYNFIPNIKDACKKIVVIHDLTPLHECKEDNRRKKLKERYQKTVDYADVIFVDSQYTRDDLIKNINVDENKIIVNYCGVDYNKFSEDIEKSAKEKVKEKYKLPSEYLLFAGQPRRNKNIEGLLKGYNLLPPEVKEKYKIVLTNSNSTIHKQVEDLNLEKNVVELQGVKEEDLVAVYKLASALALISFSEGFGLPLLEAMAAGTPTVASNVSCLPEIAGDASLLCDPYNFQDICDKIQMALTNAKVRSELIEKGKRRAKEFSWEATSEKFIRKIKEYTSIS